MKWLALVLSVYLLLLAGLPCDADCLVERVRTEATGEPVGDESTHEGWCSPLCQCAGCAGFVIPQSVQLPHECPGPPARPVRLRTTYVNPSTVDFHGRIWQPPRFA